MEQHYIICGYGRIGNRIANVLRSAGLSVVIVELNEDNIDRIQAGKHVYVKGDAQDENILKQQVLIGLKPSSAPCPVIKIMYLQPYSHEN